MVKDNEYMEEAYQALLEISADEQKRLWMKVFKMAYEYQENRI